LEEEIFKGKFDTVGNIFEGYFITLFLQGRYKIFVTPALSVVWLTFGMAEIF
jgi:hypothetical protein